MFFDNLNAAIRNSEASLVNLLSAIAPWAAPLAPAYMTFMHMESELNYPVIVAFAVAGVVEILGLSAVSTILAFWAHNRRYKTEYRKAPVLVAVLSFVSYLLVILTVNVVLEAAKIPGSFIDPAWIKVIAQALLTLLNVPAAVLLAIRTQHKEALDEIEEIKKSRKALSPRPVMLESSTPLTLPYTSRKKAIFYEDFTSGRLQKRLDDNNLTLTAENIAKLYNTSPRNAFRWLSLIKGEVSND